MSSSTAASSRTSAAASRMRLGAAPLFATASTSTTSNARLFSTAATDNLSLPEPPTSNHPHEPLVGANGSIIYTETDEAPALATYSLYPVIRKVRLRMK